MPFAFPDARLQAPTSPVVVPCSGWPPPARSTTASRPWSAGCCSTPTRCSPTLLIMSSRSASARGLDRADLALLTDGLRAEREQGITIDVAYRYFATPARKFILADCPGHVQYTRNTVTGSSTADVIVLLVDARKGVVEQTRRHLAVASLLRVPHVVLGREQDRPGGLLRGRLHTRSPPTLPCWLVASVSWRHIASLCQRPRVTTS